MQNLHNGTKCYRLYATVKKYQVIPQASSVLIGRLSLVMRLHLSQIIRCFCEVDDRCEILASSAKVADHLQMASAGALIVVLHETWVRKSLVSYAKDDAWRNISVRLIGRKQFFEMKAFNSHSAVLGA